jgi:hypothetical protein
MSVELNSAEDLLNLLAGDDEEVPETLIRRGKKKARNEHDAASETMQMRRLNQVEEWMKRDEVISLDPRGYFDFGMTLFEQLLNAETNALPVPIVQKLTKLVLLWIKLSKSCRLLEPVIKVEDIVNCVNHLYNPRKLPNATFDSLLNVVSALISCSPDRLMVSPVLIGEFNLLNVRWAKGTLKLNADKILSQLPVDFVASLTFPPSRRHFLNTQIISFLMKMLKKSNRIEIDLNLFVESISSNQTETEVIRLAGAYLRSKKTSLPIENWVRSVADRDPKTPGTSLKNIQLAKQLVRDIEK